MKREIVGRVDEIPAGGRKLITPWKGLAGIGVFNINGEFYALRNLCPHKLGPLCVGRVSGISCAQGGGIKFEKEGEVIRCPWHLWEFDIKTGQCLTDPRVRVKTYPVYTEGATLLVECEAREP